MVIMTATVASVRYLYPKYQACEEIHNEIKFTGSSWEHFGGAKRKLETQYTRVESTGKKYLHTLEESINPDNEDTIEARRVMSALSSVQGILEKCRQLVKEQEQRSKQPVESDADTASHQQETTDPDEPLPRAITTAVGTNQVSLNETTSSGKHESLSDPAPSVPPISEGHSESVTKASANPEAQESDQLQETNHAHESGLAQGHGDAQNDEKSGKEIIPKKKLRFSFRRSRSPSSNGSSMLRRLFLGNRTRSSASQDSTQTSQNSTQTLQSTSPSNHGMQSSAKVGAEVTSPTASTTQIEEDDASQVQDQASMPLKVKWDKRAREAYYSHVSELKKFSIDLEFYLREKSSPSTAWASNTPTGQAHLVPTETQKVQNAIQRLHRSFRGINRHKTPGILSLQLAEDFGLAGQDFISMADDFRLRPGSLYFTLQRQESKGFEAAELFVAETLLADNSEADEPMHSARCLSFERAATLGEQSSDDIFEKWGVLQNKGTSGDQHWLFKDIRNEWKSCGDLATSLTAPEPKATLKRIQRIQLAVVIAKSYLYLTLVRPQCEAISAASLQYFILKEEKNVWDAQNPRILSPYLSFGFGQRMTGHTVGDKNINARNLGTPMYDLGVILINIALCEYKPFGNGSNNSAEARSWALTKIKEAESLISLPFAEIARDCLQYRKASLESEEFQAESRFLVQIETRLLELKQELNGTLAGEDVPKLHTSATASKA